MNERKIIKSNWKSRKLWVAVGIIASGIAASFVLPAFECFAWLRGLTFEIFKAVLWFAAGWIFVQGAQNATFDIASVLNMKRDNKEG